jgi:large subunit ribosomal protein LP1
VLTYQQYSQTPHTFIIGRDIMALFTNKEQHDEMCATYATLILQDAGIEITADGITKLVGASGNVIEPYWAPLFAKLCAEKDLTKLLLTGGGGGGSGGGGGGAAGGDAAEAVEEEEEKEEEEEEVELGGGLFGDDGGGDGDY